MPLTPNAFWAGSCVSRSRFEPLRLGIIVFYKGKFEYDANGCRVVRVPCPIHAACRQKQGGTDGHTHTRTHELKVSAKARGG